MCIRVSNSYVSGVLKASSYSNRLNFWRKLRTGPRYPTYRAIHNSWRGKKKFVFPVHLNVTCIVRQFDASFFIAKRTRFALKKCPIFDSTERNEIPRAIHPGDAHTQALELVRRCPRLSSINLVLHVTSTRYRSSGDPVTEETVESIFSSATFCALSRSREIHGDNPCEICHEPCRLSGFVGEETIDRWERIKISVQSDRKKINASAFDFNSNFVNVNT